MMIRTSIIIKVSSLCSSLVLLFRPKISTDTIVIQSIINIGLVINELKSYMVVICKVNPSTLSLNIKPISNERSTKFIVFT